MPFYLPGLQALLNVKNTTKSWVPKEKKRKAEDAVDGEGGEKKAKGEGGDKEEGADGDVETAEKKPAEPVVKMVALDDDGDDELVSPGAARQVKGGRGRAGGAKRGRGRPKPL